MRVTVTSANITGNPLRLKRYVRRRMRRALAQPGAVFGQEIARSNRWRRGNYSRMWHRVAETFGKRTAGGPREVPISVPLAWESLGSNSIEVHAGKRGVSPARYITVARYRIDGHKVAFVNCHPVSKPRRFVPFSRWRISHWDEYFAALGSVVAAEHADGFTVFFGGDMNKPERSIPQIHPAQVDLIHAGLDHLWAVPAEGVTVRVVSRRKIGRSRFMDHPILIVSFDLRSAA